VRAAAVQLNSTEDTDRNLATADRRVRQAAGMGPELVLLPEVRQRIPALKHRRPDACGWAL
jgi:predicted amidohydrolase